MKIYRFTARIESGDGGGAFVFFPYDPEKEFGAVASRVPVKATFDGVAYDGSLIKYGEPLLMLPVLKSVRGRIGKAPGDTVAVEVRLDETERVLQVPEDLAKLPRRRNCSPFSTS